MGLRETRTGSAKRTELLAYPGQLAESRLIPAGQPPADRLGGDAEPFRRLLASHPVVLDAFSEPVGEQLHRRSRDDFYLDLAVAGYERQIDGAHPELGR